jgi:urease gamma subunit
MGLAMKLTQKELDRLNVFTLAELARKRQSRGLKLNHPEAVAIIVDELFEAARDGLRYEEAVQIAQNVLSREDVLPGVPEMIPMLQVDAMFPDGTKLVTIRNPIQ